MTEPESGELTKPGPNAEVVTTRVNVAFPFSQIRVEQPSEEFAVLADLVRDLADALRDVAPSSNTDELAKRAQQLSTRLR